jgi:hypothetical protein
MIKAKQGTVVYAARVLGTWVAEATTMQLMSDMVEMHAGAAGIKPCTA